MGLITAPDSPPMRFVWSSLNTGDRLQHLKDNHLIKTCVGLAMQIQKSVMELSGSTMILATPL
jgi:hypothetical protein